MFKVNKIIYLSEKYQMQGGVCVFPFHVYVCEGETENEREEKKMWV